MTPDYLRLQVCDIDMHGYGIYPYARLWLGQWQVVSCSMILYFSGCRQDGCGWRMWVKFRHRWSKGNWARSWRSGQAHSFFFSKGRVSDGGTDLGLHLDVSVSVFTCVSVHGCCQPSSCRKADRVNRDQTGGAVKAIGNFKLWSIVTRIISISQSCRIVTPTCRYVCW